ncbi:HlyD family secretion protein [Rhodocyclus tenuis]|uniref:HlyD family secretion protein n=1 Tax=Rhodocyclus tenuis TaxID=1066 RepID=UPI00190418DD|nr:HlyD family secretion protein [Rhodocyclus tenuis]MBK1678804.1 secretion protein HlyD [Rhodocyclus tenuis]
MIHSSEARPAALAALPDGRAVPPSRRARAIRCRLTLALCATLFVTACEKTPSGQFTGYAEGEYLYLSAPAAGYLATLDAPRGERVAAGAPVFSLAADPDRQSVAEADARVTAAAEKLKNLDTPRRTPEIEALAARLRAAEASQRLSETQLAQQQALAAKGFVAPTRLDEARAAQARDAAASDAARQDLANARTSFGRTAEVRGAAAEASAAQAEAERRRWQLAQKHVSAPAAGEIAETYYRPGEWVAAGQPVASLLPDDRRRIRFFVPEAQIATLKPGQAVEASCDGCVTPIRGSIDFISPRAEFTPPVIYSRDSREKLVFRVEARPTAADAARLRPGQPLDVRALEQ